MVLNMPILDTRKYKELEGVGKLVTDIILMLLSWMVEEERNRIRTAQLEGIVLARNTIYSIKKEIADLDITS